jgi:ubiquinone/menaquinone biosynthesis C-methylase UbiE
VPYLASAELVPARSALSTIDRVSEPAFATDPAVAAYYERRAAEYDEWYESTGLFADRDRPGWAEEVEDLLRLLASLPAGRTLDVACGTGFLSRRLSGLVVGVDQSQSMIEIARRRLPGALAVVADALALPFVADCFDRVFTGHFYGHLPAGERSAFLSEARRVGRELTVVDSAPRNGVPKELVQERVLNDGSQHRVFKRFLSGPELASEIGGRVLHDGRWFAAATVQH